jgi:hypothetical protein
MTVHSVVYGDTGGSHCIVTREVFESGGRILGTETTTKRWFEGEWSGWHWRSATTETRHFATRSEASDWVDEMFRAHQTSLTRKAIDRARDAWERSQPQLFLEV